VKETQVGNGSAASSTQREWIDPKGQENPEDQRQDSADQA
jgi:hypothetical protein